MSPSTRVSEQTPRSAVSTPLPHTAVDEVCRVLARVLARVKSSQGETAPAAEGEAS